MGVQNTLGFDLLESKLGIDITDTEAFLVRKHNDGGDIFTIDTENSAITYGAGVTITGGTVQSSRLIDVTDTEAFLVRKNGDTGDIFAVDTTNGVVSFGGVTPVTGTRIILPQEDDAVTPTLAFGDGNTGFYESGDNTLTLATSGIAKWRWSGNQYYGIATDSFGLQNETASAINPTLSPNRNDMDTGIGWAAADQLSLIAGALEMMNLIEGATSSVGFKVNDAAGTPIVPTGALKLFAHNKSVADEGIVTLPAITSHGRGTITCGDTTNGITEIADFAVDDDGLVSLLNGSSNVVMNNAGADGKLVLGTTAAAQESLIIKNRTGATKVLNIIFWYD